MTRQWRQVPDDIDAVSLMEFLRDHRMYLQIHAQMMGYEVERVYRIFTQKDTHYAPELDWVVWEAALKCLEDLKACGIWGSWEDEYEDLVDRIRNSLDDRKAEFERMNEQHKKSGHKFKFKFV